MGVSMIEPSGFAIKPRIPAKLTDLGVGAPSAGVRHHINGIERLLIDGFAFFIHHFIHAQFAHHSVGDLFTGAGPDIDDFVVALTVR